MIPSPSTCCRACGAGKSHEQEQLRQLKQMLDRLPQLPPELQEKLKAMPPELRAQLDALPPAAPARPDPAPLLRYLVAVGLVTEERTGPDDANPDLTCHELVRERIRAWMQDHPQDRADLTENTIRLAYAERLEAVFKALQHQNMTAALEAGSRALVYCVQAGAYDRLGGFASGVVTSTSDPRLLAGLLPHLELAAESAPEGKPRWSCLCYLADALRMAGRPDASLPFYEQAATQARTAAEAGGENGAPGMGGCRRDHRQLGERSHDDRRPRRRAPAAPRERRGREKSGQSSRPCHRQRAGGPAHRHHAGPGPRRRCRRWRRGWRRWRPGGSSTAPASPCRRRPIPSSSPACSSARSTSPRRPTLPRRTGNLPCAASMPSWRSKRALERPAEDIAATRMNRANVLRKLGRFGEAKAELEDCLQVFQNDPARRARVLSSLADLFDEQGDVAQAITQERRALALCEQLPDPGDRAISHNNLANYLERSGTPSALAESPRHQLAALIYRLVSGLGQDLQTSLRNYAIDFRRAHAAGTELAVPRVAELLADPAFRPLDDWLRQRQADVAEVQAAVDQVLDQARQLALEQK